MVNSMLKGLKSQGHTDGSSEYEPGQASGEMCKVDVGTRPHQVTLGGASHTAYVKAAVPSDSAALEPLSLPGQLGSVAQGNRCLKPENLLPCPSLYPKRTKDPSSQTGHTVRSSLLFGWPQGEKVRMRQAEGPGGILFCPVLTISPLHWNSPMGDGVYHKEQNNM